MNANQSTWIRRFSSSFGLGYLPAAGTWASAVTFAVIVLLPFEKSALYVFVITSVLGFALATKAKHAFKAKDPSAFVLDEWAGMSLCLAAVPNNIGVWVVTFVIFRLFDINKPLGISRLDGMSHSSFIMWDDFLAAFYTILSVWGLLYLIP